MKKFVFVAFSALLAFAPMHITFAGGGDYAGSNCGFKKDEQVKVKWQGKWYKARILKINDDCTRFYIHYIGWSSSWDEWVTPDRIAMMK